jgi:hypothetical protein
MFPESFQNRMVECRVSMGKNRVKTVRKQDGRVYYYLVERSDEGKERVLRPLTEKEALELRNGVPETKSEPSHFPDIPVKTGPEELVETQAAADASSKTELLTAETEKPRLEGTDDGTDSNGSVDPSVSTVGGDFSVEALGGSRYRLRSIADPKQSGIVSVGKNGAVYCGTCPGFKPCIHTTFIRKHPERLPD